MRRERSVVVLAVMAILAGTVVEPPPAEAFPRPGRTERVSVSGGERSGQSFEASISADGRYVAFHSSSASLVPEDTNGTLDIFVHDSETGTIELVSIASEGDQGNGPSIRPSISGDGRFVAFQSAASNLVPEDTNGALDIFVHDRESGTTRRASIDSEGNQSNGPSLVPSISADGHHVGFHSDATNLVAGDANLRADVFVHDLDTGITEMVSIASEGAQGGSHSQASSLSGDGSIVAFQSFASNLVFGDTNGASDVFVRDRTTGTTEVVSVSEDGLQADGPSQSPSISAEGLHIAYQSVASNLVPADANGVFDVFVHHRDTANTERVSVASDGTEGGDASTEPSISADGRYVAFGSEAMDLVPEDTNFRPDIFVRDRENAATERVSVSADGTQGDDHSFVASISADGRYAAFQSSAANLVAGDGDLFQDIFVRDRGPIAGVGEISVTPERDRVKVSGWATFSGAVLTSAEDASDDGIPGAGEITEASLIYRPEDEDLLARLQLQSLPTVPAGAGGAVPGIVYGLGFALDGARYELRAFRPASSPVAPSFALYRCEVECTEEARLTGGIGTTGDEVLISLPLSTIGADEGSALRSIAAFTAAGEEGEPRAPLDQAELSDASIPVRTVSLGIAPAGTPEDAVTFEAEGVLTDGTFSADLDAATSPTREVEIWARGCLDAACGTSSAAATLDEPTGNTEAVFTDRSETFGQHTDDVFLEARLDDPLGDPFGDAALTFTLTGAGSARSFNAVTDEDGIAAVTVTLQERPGSYDLSVSYEGEGPSIETTGFVVEKEDSAAQLAVRGLEQSMALEARLSDLDSSDAVAGRTIEFFSDADFIGSGRTGPDGVAAIALPPGHRSSARTYAAIFEGDDHFLSSRAERHGRSGGVSKRTRRGAIAHHGGPANASASSLTLSADGRIAVWESRATDIVPDDTNDERDIFARDVLTGETMLVSKANDGSQADSGSTDPAISGNGRYVAFASGATNLIPGDKDAAGGLFVHDLVTGRNQRVSVSSAGELANKQSLDTALSHDGRYIVFNSYASNLVEGDENLYPDIYVHDRVRRTTEVVSVDSEGRVHDGGALFPDISPDGRYATFQSFSDELVPGDSNGSQDVFVHDRQTGTTEIASVSTDGAAGNRSSREPSISEGGRYVAFSSFAATLVPEDTNNASDIFVRDRTTDTTRRVSVTSSGTAAESGGTPFAPGSYFPSISPDGRYVAYQSDAPNLMADDTADFDVFVHDLVTGSTTAGVKGLDGSQPDGGAGSPEIGSDGRYLTFLSNSTNLVAEGNEGQFDWFIHDRGPSAGIGALSAEVEEDTLSAEGWATFAGDRIASALDAADDAEGVGSEIGSDLAGVTLAVRPELGDLFIRWEVHHLPGIRTALAGVPGVVHALAFEVDGIRYEIRALRVGATAAPPRAPFFGLYRCDQACIEVGELEGGYGESGLEITTSVALGSLGLDEPIAMQDVTAFSGPGDASTGALHRLDEVALGDVSIPEIEVGIGIAAAGSDLEGVTFDEIASFTDGRFTAEIPVGHLAAGYRDVWARGCLGPACGVAVEPVTLGDPVIPTPTVSPTASPSPSPSEPPQPEITTMALTDRSEDSGQYSDETRFEALLTDSAGDPVADAELTFELLGAESSRNFPAVTDEDGVASVTPRLLERPGPQQLTVRYAGDEDRAGSADVASFVIEKEDSALELEVHGRGQSKTLKAYLSDLDAPTEGIGDRTIDFYSDSEPIGSVRTGPDGVAQMSVPPAHRGANREYEAFFPGDDFYLPSSGAPDDDHPPDDRP